MTTELCVAPHLATIQYTLDHVLLISVGFGTSLFSQTFIVTLLTGMQLCDWPSASKVTRKHVELLKSIVCDQKYAFIVLFRSTSWYMLYAFLCSFDSLKWASLHITLWIDHMPAFLLIASANIVRHACKGTVDIFVQFIAIYQTHLLSLQCVMLYTFKNAPWLLRIFDYHVNP